MAETKPMMRRSSASSSSVTTVMWQHMRCEISLCYNEGSQSFSLSSKRGILKSSHCETAMISLVCDNVTMITYWHFPDQTPHATTFPPLRVTLVCSECNQKEHTGRNKLQDMISLKHPARRAKIVRFFGRNAAKRGEPRSQDHSYDDDGVKEYNLTIANRDPCWERRLPPWAVGRISHLAVMNLFRGGLRLLSRCFFGSNFHSQEVFMRVREQFLNDVL